MSTAHLSEMCVNCFGANFFRNARMVCRYVNSIYANEVITTYGIVTDKIPKGNGYRFVVETWAANDEGGKKTVGTVEVDVDA